MRSLLSAIAAVAFLTGCAPAAATGPTSTPAPSARAMHYVGDVPGPNGPGRAYCDSASGLLVVVWERTHQISGFPHGCRR